MAMNSMVSQAPAFLDEVHSKLAGDCPSAAMGELFTGLDRMRYSSTAADWQLQRKRVLEHGLLAVIHEDPMTRRSFEKPRGYAGDAVLLDYIYGLSQPTQASDVGRSVYDYAAGRPAARGVRLRREWLAHAIDRASDRAGGRAHVLSVACGHLREAEISSALRGGGIERLIALDADPTSLGVVNELGLDCITTVEMSVGRLLGRAKSMGKFDLAYSAGLYDYLEPGLARRLTTCLFGTLAPGGHLIISNFLPTISDAGYMETFMGWDLIYRTEEDLAGLAAQIPSDQITSLRTHSDPFGAIAYLEIERRREPLPGQQLAG